MPIESKTDWERVKREYNSDAPIPYDDEDRAEGLYDPERRCCGRSRVGLGNGNARSAREAEETDQAAGRHPAVS